MSLTDNERAKLSVLFDVFPCVDTSQIDTPIANCRDYEKYCRTNDDIARAQIAAQSEDVATKIDGCISDMERQKSDLEDKITQFTAYVAILRS